MKYLQINVPGNVSWNLPVKPVDTYPAYVGVTTVLLYVNYFFLGFKFARIFIHGSLISRFFYPDLNLSYAEPFYRERSG